MGLFRKKPVEPSSPLMGSNGFGEPIHYVFEKRPFTYGQGANTQAFETLLLPTYTPIGWGVQPQRQLKVNSGGVMFSTQGVTLQTLGDPGNLTGSLVQQPLVNASNNDSAVSPLPVSNVIPNGGMS